jgi:hypothetical protein
MSLYEHGRFKLTDPVHRYLPEWRDQRVGVVDADGTLQLVEPERPVQQVAEQLRQHLRQAAAVAVGRRGARRTRGSAACRAR